MDRPSDGSILSKAPAKQKKDSLLELTPIWIWASINSSPTNLKPNIKNNRDLEEPVWTPRSQFTPIYDPTQGANQPN